MKITIISNKGQGVAFPLAQAPGLTSLNWENSIHPDPESQLCIDLDFDNTGERVLSLEKAFPGLIAVNSVITTLDKLPQRFIRFNGWNGFLKGTLIEAAASEINKEKAEASFGLLGKKLEWVVDEPGFISARILSMIINEAYYALEEKLSSMEEIDTAMKLGTNYPLGPFEWSKEIGLEKIHALLKKLSLTNNRYLPAPLLEKEATK